MIRLDSINKSLVFNTDSAITTNQLQIVASYSDNSGTAYTGGTNQLLSNGISNVTVVSSPISGNIRDIDNISIFNEDTVQSNVNVLLNNNGTYYQITGSLLLPQETLVYTHAQGWKTLDATGAMKNATVATTAQNLIGTPTLPSGVSGTTQSTGDTSANLATDLFVANAINAYQVKYPPVSFNVNSVTINIGGPPSLTSGSFNITGLSGLVAGVIVLVFLSPNQSAANASNTAYDTIELDPIIATGICINSTTIQVNWSCSSPVLGSYVFNYILNSISGGNPILTYTANHTLNISDYNSYIIMSSSSAIMLTIPNSTTTSFPIGTVFNIEQGGAGIVTINPATGVTLENVNYSYTTSSMYAVVGIKLVASNTWVLVGSTT